MVLYTYLLDAMSFYDCMFTRPKWVISHFRLPSQDRVVSNVIWADPVFYRTFSLNLALYKNLAQYKEKCMQCKLLACLRNLNLYITSIFLPLKQTILSIEFEVELDVLNCARIISENLFGFWFANILLCYLNFMRLSCWQLG